MHKKSCQIHTSLIKLYSPIVSRYNTICVCTPPCSDYIVQHFCWYYVPVILLPTAARKFGKNHSHGSQTRIARSISVKDVIAVLEREPQMSKSSLLYRMHERIHSDTSTEWGKMKYLGNFFLFILPLCFLSSYTYWLINDIILYLLIDQWHYLMLIDWSMTLTYA